MESGSFIGLSYYVHPTVFPRKYGGIFSFAEGEGPALPHKKNYVMGQPAGTLAAFPA